MRVSLKRIDARGATIEAAPARMDAFRSRDRLAERVLRTGIYRSPPTSGNVFRRDLCVFLRDADYDPFVDGIMLFAAPCFGDVASLPDVLARYRIHGHNDSGPGRLPEARPFQRDMDQSVRRMKHLRAVLCRIGLDREVVDPRRTLYHQERRFCLAIASGKRPTVRNLLLLLSKVDQNHSMRNKLAVAVFLILGCHADTATASALMAYQFSAVMRSARGLFKAALSRWSQRRTTDAPGIRRP